MSSNIYENGNKAQVYPSWGKQESFHLDDINDNNEVPCQGPFLLNSIFPDMQVRHDRNMIFSFLSPFMQAKVIHSKNLILKKYWDTHNIKNFLSRLSTISIMADKF